MGKPKGNVIKKESSSKFVTTLDKINVVVINAMHKREVLGLQRDYTKSKLTN